MGFFKRKTKRKSPAKVAKIVNFCCTSSSTNYYHDEQHSRLQGKSTAAGTKAVAEAGFFSNKHHALWLDTMDKVLKQTVEKPSWPASFDISARW